MTTSRWFSTGVSDHADARTAGREAAAAAMAGPDPALFTVFAGPDVDPDGLMAGVAEVAPGLPVIGCSTAGELTADAAGDVGVVAAGLGGAGLAVRVAGRSSEGRGLRRAAREVAQELAGTDDEPPPSVVILLSDGLAGDQEDAIRGFYDVFGLTAPLVGGCAGDDLRMAATWQAHGTSTISDGGVVAAALWTEGPVGVGVEHGWVRVGDPLVVTGSDGTDVLTLDGRPALDVYLERLDLDPAPDAFAELAATRPLGLDRRNGEEVRFIGGADFDARTLHAFSNVPQGSLVWLMEGTGDSVLEATTCAYRQATAQLGGAEPIGVLAFDCIARRGVLGEGGIGAEIRTLNQLAAGAPVAGFYTYGEFARLDGVRGFHNQTLVVLALA